VPCQIEKLSGNLALSTGVYRSLENSDSMSLCSAHPNGLKQCIQIQYFGIRSAMMMLPENSRKKAPGIPGQVILGKNELNTVCTLRRQHDVLLKHPHQSIHEQPYFVLLGLALDLMGNPETRQPAPARWRSWQLWRSPLWNQDITVGVLSKFSSF